MAEKVDRMIRNLDLDTYNRAQGHAKALGYKNFGAYVNEALELKLSLPTHPQAHVKKIDIVDEGLKLVWSDGGVSILLKDGRVKSIPPSGKGTVITPAPKKARKNG
ncbi:hypothetical protein ES703_84739 [subsurface metagenome]